MIVTRPFAGLAAECDLVAMREFLPSATAPLPLREPRDVPVTLATVLPGASAALVRPNGEILLGDAGADPLRRPVRRPRPGAALGAGRRARLGAAGRSRRRGRARSACRTCSTSTRPLDLTLHTDFALVARRREDGGAPSAEVTATLERANAVIMPTEPVVADGVRAAYWVDTGTKAHLRWVRPEPEDALRRRARPAAGRAASWTLTEDARYAGAFRAHGLLVPVWDLDRELHAKEWAEPGGGVRRPAGRGAGRRRRRSPTPSAAPATRWPASRSRSGGTAWPLICARV